ncbi:MAG: hypothetical protein PHQ40_10270 [Anaerolineaceae bacterium]|nr:hypothetical protein [Anaerolineaceae bacterium]
MNAPVEPAAFRRQAELYTWVKNYGDFLIFRLPRKDRNGEWFTRFL